MSADAGAKRAERLAEIVAEALERAAADRPAFLVEACGVDNALRAEAESLLRYEHPAQAFKMPALAEHGRAFLATAPAVAVGVLQPGQLLGECRIVSLLGQGGMGEVYLARDLSLGRQVAVKVVKRVMASESLLRNFDQEKRILATLNDPHIARLYGGAVAPDGLPYLVMEYVEGERLDDYCERRRLRAPEPRHPSRPQARQHQRHGCGRTEALGFRRRQTARSASGRRRRGTDRHPECGTDAGLRQPGAVERRERDHCQRRVQPRGSALSAFDRRGPRRASQGRPPREDATADSIRPSLALSRAWSGQATVDGHSAPPPATPPDAQPRALRGDLDNIVLKAMRPEPARRYVSAAQLSDDVGRFLAGLPVAARPDTFGYRASKFIRRHRVAVAAALLVFLSVIGGLLVALWETRIAREQRDLAQRERAKAERINDFLQRTLSFSNQDGLSVPVTHSRDVTVIEMLGEIAPHAAEQLADSPEVRAQVLRTIGNAYASQGRLNDAEKNLREALRIQQRLSGGTNTEIASTLLDLGALTYRQSKFKESKAFFVRGVAFYRRCVLADAPPSDLAVLATALDDLAVVKSALGDIRVNRELLEEAMQIAVRADLAHHDPGALANIETDLGGSLIDTGELERGEALLREALGEWRRRSPRPSLVQGVALTLLGYSARERNQFDEAAKFLREGEQIYRQTIGDNNTFIVYNLNQQIKVALATENFAWAETAAREILAYNASIRPDSPENQVYTAVHLETLADILIRAGRAKEGEDDLRQALSILERQPTPDFHWIVLGKFGLSQSLAD